MERECTVHKLVVDVAIHSKDKVLLARYKDVSRYDGQRGWFLPEDYLGHVEHPDDAAKRIARDQAGVTLANLRLRHVESFGNGAWHLIFHYEAHLAESAHVHPGLNVAALEWFPRSALPARSAVAHEGWAIDVLDTMDGKRSEKG